MNENYNVQLISMKGLKKGNVFKINQNILVALEDADMGYIWVTKPEYYNKEYVYTYTSANLLPITDIDVKIIEEDINNYMRLSDNMQNDTFIDNNKKYPDDMDKECIPLCDLFNSIGLTTQFSCCGHGESRFQIIFADNITDEQIYPFIERLSQTYSYTPIIGGFLKWTRKVDDKIASNWTYQVDKIEWADLDLENMKKYIGGVE